MALSEAISGRGFSRWFRKRAETRKAVPPAHAYGADGPRAPFETIGDFEFPRHTRWGEKY